MQRAAMAAVLTAAALAAAPAAQASDRSLGYSGRCPIDVIFPLFVDAERAREFVPPGYSITTEPLGQAFIVVSFVACEDTVVDGVTRSSALYSDLLFQVSPPPGSGTPFVDQKFDAYWAWLITDEPVVHTELSRMGMFTALDPSMSVTPTYTPDGERLLALDGAVSWPDSPFRIHGDVLDVRPLGVPPYFNHFWHDVHDGRMKAKLNKLPGQGGFFGEEGRLANLTLTTPLGTPLARLLGSQCRPDPGAGSCSASGPGAVTYLPHFTYEVSVLH